MSDFISEELNFSKPKKKTEIKKVSPYKEFTNWLINSAPNVSLSHDCIKAVSPRVALTMLGKYPNITVFLNEHFNNWNLYSIKPEEFFLFVRQLVRRFGLNDLYNMYASEKSDKSLTEIHKYFPCLKREEVFNLLELVKDDEEYPSFMESLGLTNYKVKKLKKTKESKENITPTKKEPKKIENIIINHDKLSFLEWKGYFNVK